METSFKHIVTTYYVNDANATKLAAFINRMEYTRMAQIHYGSFHCVK